MFLAARCATIRIFFNYVYEECMFGKVMDITPAPPIIGMWRHAQRSSAWKHRREPQLEFVPGNISRSL